MNRKLGVLLDITTVCPHRCVYCFHQRESLLPPSFMEVETFEAILPILKKEGFNRIHLYMSGEPLTHPNFYDFLNRCGEEGFTTNVATKAAIPINWVALIGAMTAFSGRRKKDGNGSLRWLIEVPAFREENVKEICVMDFKKQHMNLSEFGKMAICGEWKNVSWKVVTIATKWNEDDLALIKRMLAKMGLRDWSIKRPGYYMEQVLKEKKWLPSMSYSRRLTQGRDKCPFPKNVAISTEGDVTVCCHDMLFKIRLGNVAEEKTLQGIIDRNAKVMKDRLSMSLGICGSCN